MKKFKAQAILEILLIAALVAVISVTTWAVMNKKTIDLAKLSSIGTSSKYESTQLSENSKSLLTLLQEQLAKLKSNPKDNNQRIETAGTIGKLIAGYKKNMSASLLAELSKEIQEMANIDGNPISEEQAKSCATDPASCSTLMTVSGFNWSNVKTQAYLDSTYCLIKGAGDLTDPLPITLTYKNTYVNKDGDMVTETYTQSVFIEKENFRTETYRGKFLSDFLDAFVPVTFTDKFTGSGVEVQKTIDSYIKNDILSASKTEYVDLSSHSSYNCASTCVNP